MQLFLRKIGSDNIRVDHEGLPGDGDHTRGVFHDAFQIATSDVCNFSLAGSITTVGTMPKDLVDGDLRLSGYFDVVSNVLFTVNSRFETRV